MPLTDLQVKKAKGMEKPQKLADGAGLYLLVQPNGAKYWRLKYRFAGVEKVLALGVYPDVTLSEVRERREAARKLLANGADPGAVKKAKKAASVALTESSFEIVAREWYMKHAPNWADTHASKVIRRLEVDVFPWIGERPIGEITARELLVILRRVEDRGAIDTAHRVHQNCGQVFRYAIATGRAQRDPSADLRGAIPPPNRRHYPTLTDPQAIGELLRAIDGYNGTHSTRYALRLAPTLFVRPSELRKAEWCEFNLDKAEWRIPATRMKMKTLHIVPLSTQAVAILRELYCISGTGKYLFPSPRTATKPMSDNTVNAALHRLGYKGEFVGHGFRHMACTLLNEQGWNRDAIERQLGHAERDGVRAAYNYAEYLPERKRMMQAWADYLDALVRGADVAPITRVA
jgi:integrase